MVPSTGGFSGGEVGEVLGDTVDGAAVGAPVEGAADGVGVGDKLGCFVGEVDGANVPPTRVGALLGCGVGTSLGAVVGVRDGAAVVGDVVGCALDGDRDGLTVGDVDGEYVVGANEGRRVGLSVGGGVGAIVGSSVGPTALNCVPASTETRVATPSLSINDSPKSLTIVKMASTASSTSVWLTVLSKVTVTIKYASRPALATDATAVISTLAICRKSTTVSSSNV